MIYKIFAIKDVKVGFMQPFMQVNEGVAVREFKNLVNSANSVVSVNYTDMELYCLGTYNLDTGAIESDVKYVVKGADVKEVVDIERAEG